MRDRWILKPRRCGRGGAYMRIPVHRTRRCLKRVVARMIAARWPRHRIATSLSISRRAVDHHARRVVWHG